MFSKEVPALLTSIFPSCLSTTISLDVSSFDESEELSWFEESLELFSSLGELCSLEVELSLFEDSSEMEIVKESESGKEAIEDARLYKPDIILMDIGLPDINGIEVAKRILADNKKVKIIMLTSHSSEKEVTDSLLAGASAYVMKDFDTSDFLMIIKTVNNGAMWLDPLVVPYIREKNSGIIPARQVSRAAFREQHSNLTQREYEVLKLVVDGKSNNDIAKELCKPGRDPRDELPAPILRKDVLEIKDLKPGMELTGTVRNVIDFGVFVDIGVHQDGLVHISQVCNRRLRHPSEAVKVGDIVKVVVLEVDEKRHRISLSMKQAKQ